MESFTSRRESQTERHFAASRCAVFREEAHASSTGIPPRATPRRRPQPRGRRGRGRSLLSDRASRRLASTLCWPLEGNCSSPHRIQNTASAVVAVCCMPSSSSIEMSGMSPSHTSANMEVDISPGQEQGPRAIETLLERFNVSRTLNTRIVPSLERRSSACISQTGPLPLLDLGGEVLLEGDVENREPHGGSNTKSSLSAQRDHVYQTHFRSAASSPRTPVPARWRGIQTHSTGQGQNRNLLFPIPRFTRASVEPENRGFLTSVSPQPRPSASAMTSSTMAPGCPGLRPRTRIAKTGDAPGRPCQHCTRRLDIPCFRLVK